MDGAALVGGALCHLREMDDVHYTILHPGAVCMPAALAVGHVLDKRLDEVLLSPVLGHEVMIGIADGQNDISHRQLGWHGTATWGPFGSAADAGVLLGLDPRQMSWAIGAVGFSHRRYVGVHPGRRDE